jgi:hypothetical protein
VTVTAATKTFRYSFYYYFTSDIGGGRALAAARVEKGF